MQVGPKLINPERIELTPFERTKEDKITDIWLLSLYSLVTSLSAYCFAFYAFKASALAASIVTISVGIVVFSVFYCLSNKNSPEITSMNETDAKDNVAVLGK